MGAEAKTKALPVTGFELQRTTLQPTISFNKLFQVSDNIAVIYSLYV